MKFTGPGTGKSAQLACMAAFTFFSAPQMQAGWVAYNDSAYKPGQENAFNATTFGLGRNFQGEASSGYLVEFMTGDVTPVLVEFEEHFSTGSINSAGDFAEFVPGTDAEALFGGKVDISGNMSYGDSPGWHLDLILSGLDPGGLYTFAATANRNGGEGYIARVTNWRIMEAEGYTYASSEGAHRVADDSVEFSTGHNPEGLVARWTNIRPGSDGRIVIRTSHSVGEANGGIPGASAFQGYAGGVFLLRAQPPGEYRWAAFNDSAFKDGQLNDDFVTTYGLGRSFQGEATEGELRDLLSGKFTGVYAQFEEHFSTGSINSAGDPAQFPPGSDAEAYFKGIADLSGNMSYGDSPGWWLDLTFTGLDPAKGYTFVGTADRNGGEGYAARVTNWRIMNTASHLPASSNGAHRVGEDSVEFSTGYNAQGLVARWVDIQPGADGAFTIRTSHSVGEANGGIPGASAFQGYAGGLFMLAEQTTLGGGGPEPVEFSSLFPPAEARDVHPNAPVVVVLRHGDSAVNPATVLLKVNDLEVAAEVISEQGSTTIRHQPAAMLEAGSSHVVNLTFMDDAAIPRAYSREWSFTVLDYSQSLVLPSELGVNYNPAMHRTRGFALEVAAVDPFWDFVIADMETAEALWEWEYFNMADETILNEFGYFIETRDLNYQIDGAARGARANDRLFPGISRELSGDQFALQAHALLHLKPGFYRMNVSMTQEFKIAVGGPGGELELPSEFTPCANCGGDDAPWILEFVVTEEGVYPFRLLFYSPGGGASLEWLVVTPSGSRLLINEEGVAGIPAYVPAFALPQAPALALTRSGGSITISWEGAGVLEWAGDVGGPWNELTAAPSPYTVSIQESRRFYRLKR